MADIRIRLLTGTALALAGTAFGSAAMADTSLGWYAAVDGGSGPVASQSLKVSDVTLTSGTASATPPLADGDYKLTPDYSGRGFARVGYRLTPNLRTELELGARPAKLTNGLTGADATALGSFDKTSLMANFIVDLWPESGLHPFVGVGAGVVQAKADYREPVSQNGHALVYTVQADKTVPAGQFLAGASIDVTQRLHFDMTYRYLRTGSTSYDIAVSDTQGSDVSTYSAKGQGHIEDHSLTVGFRWTFGAPARSRSVAAESAPAQTAPVVAAVLPPALPAGAPSNPATTAGSKLSSGSMGSATAEPAEPTQADNTAQPMLTAAKPKYYSTYFPLGGARLDPSAQSVVAMAAQYAQTVPQAQVRVDGYADTSGSMAYNLLLSRRRADTVAAALTANGVPGDAIQVAWHGEARPAVKTGDGVANAKNRRVTITVKAPGGKASSHRSGKHRRPRHG